MPVVTRNQSRARQAQAAPYAPRLVEQNVPETTVTNAANTSGRDHQHLPNHALSMGNMPRQPEQVPQALPRRRQDANREQQQAEIEDAMIAALIAEIAAQQHEMRRPPAAAAGQVPIDPEAENLFYTIQTVTLKAFKVAFLTCNARVNTRRLTLSLTEDFGTRWFNIAHDMWMGVFAFVLLVAILHLADVLLVRRVFSRQPVGARARASKTLFMLAGRFLEEVIPRLLVFFVW